MIIECPPIGKTFSRIFSPFLGEHFPIFFGPFLGETSGWNIFLKFLGFTFFRPHAWGEKLHRKCLTDVCPQRRNQNCLLIFLWGNMSPIVLPQYIRGSHKNKQKKKFYGIFLEEWNHPNHCFLLKVQIRDGQSQWHCWSHLRLAEISLLHSRQVGTWPDHCQMHHDHKAEHINKVN